MGTLRRLIKKSPLHRPAKKMRDAVARRLPKTNSSFCWIKEGDGVSTLVYVYNYWSENYGIRRVRLRWTLYDGAGRRRGRGVRALRPDETIVITSADLLREAGVATPFEGNLVCELRHPKLRPGLPVQMLGEYRASDGTASCVHSQWGFYERTRPKGAAGGHIHLLSDDVYETVIVSQNCSRSKRGRDLRANAPRVTFYNAEGDARTVVMRPIPPCGFARYTLREMVSDGDRFLAGGSGNARVEMWTPSIRTFHFHRRRDGSISVNHAAGDYASQPDKITPVPRATFERFGRASLAIGPAWEGDGVTSRYVLHNNYVPIGAQAFDVHLYDAEGVLKLHRPAYVVLDPRQTRVVSLGELLREGGLTAPFRGSVQFAFSLRSDTVFCPPVFQLVTELSVGGRIAGVDAGSDIFNASPGRTKIFSRALETADDETWACVANPSSDPRGGRPSSTTVSLIAADGSDRLTALVVIPAQGAFFQPLRAIFPDAAAFLARTGGLGLVKFRDVTTRLYGFHIVRHRPNGSLAIDHLIGG
jgi:hypothetical protein